MKKMKRFLAMLLTAVMVTSLLAACGSREPKNETGSTKEETTGETTGASDGESKETSEEAASTDPFDLKVCIASNPKTMDPALNAAVDGAVMMLHLFEGLMTWVEGTGDDVYGQIANGQITSYDVSDDGTVYTFHLRDDIYWSDGKPVTAEDFVYSWKRLVDPATMADYNYMIDMVLNADEIMAEEKDPDELAITAVDEKTLEITLKYDCPYFIEVCAFPATFPVRKDVIEQYGDEWTFSADSYISNGPYKYVEWAQNSQIVMEQSEYYYNKENVGPDSITFALMDDANSILASYNNGDLAFIENIPVDEVATLKDSGKLNIVDYIGTYFVTYNVEAEPFNDPLVREAFSLVIDRNYIVNNVSQAGEVPASAFVPTGVYDALGVDGDDFRTVGGDYYSVADADYQANCDKARELLAEAGYPEGKGFPVVEYIYNTLDSHKLIAEALQNMWQTELGVTVTLSNQDWAVFQDSRKNGDFQIARHGWIADYNDPVSFLDMWTTGNGNNTSQYSSKEFDALVAEVKSTSDQETRMELMHQVEDMLMEDVILAPIYFYTTKYMLQDNLDGLVYTPLGYFVYSYMTQE